MLVSTSLRSSDKKYFTIDVYITNKSKSRTFRVKDFKALIRSRKGFKEIDVLSRNEFLKKQEKKDKTKAFFKQVGANIRAYNAGENTNVTNSSSSGYSNTRTRGTVNSNSTVSDNYGNSYGNVDTQATFNANSSTYSTENTRSESVSMDGAARYAAQQIENQKVQEFKANARKERSRWNQEYLKNNTIHKDETKKGLVSVEFSKGDLIKFKVVIEGLIYEFEWDPEDAANL